MMLVLLPPLRDGFEDRSYTMPKRTERVRYCIWFATIYSAGDYPVLFQLAELLCQHWFGGYSSIAPVVCGYVHGPKCGSDGNRCCLAGNAASRHAPTVQSTGATPAGYPVDMTGWSWLHVRHHVHAALNDAA
jgi:hypothetical protein